MSYRGKSEIVIFSVPSLPWLKMITGSRTYSIRSKFNQMAFTWQEFSTRVFWGKSLLMILYLLMKKMYLFLPNPLEGNKFGSSSWRNAGQNSMARTRQSLVTMFNYFRWFTPLSITCFFRCTNNLQVNSLNQIWPRWAFWLALHQLRKWWYSLLWNKAEFKYWEQRSCPGTCIHYCNFLANLVRNL